MQLSQQIDAAIQGLVNLKAQVQVLENQSNLQENKLVTANRLPAGMKPSSPTFTAAQQQEIPLPVAKGKLPASTFSKTTKVNQIPEQVASEPEPEIKQPPKTAAAKTPVKRKGGKSK